MVFCYFKEAVSRKLDVQICYAFLPSTARNRLFFLCGSNNLFCLRFSVSSRCCFALLPYNYLMIFQLSGDWLSTSIEMFYAFVIV